MLRTLVSTALSAAAAATAGSAQEREPAAEWRHWRGPHDDGTSRESNWRSSGGPDDLWRVEVGLGYSGVVIANGLLYTLGYEQELGVDIVFALDARTGEHVWDFGYPAEIWDFLHEGGTLTTPTVDGDVLYTINREGNFHRFDAASGELTASRAFREELGLEPPTWGFAASPVVVGELVVLDLGQMVALDRETLAVRWKSEPFEPGYSTPARFRADGAWRLAAFNGRGLAVLDAATGKTLAFHPWPTQQGINAATPLVDGRRIFVSSGLEQGCAMLELGRGLEVRWQSKVMRNYMSGCAAHGGHFFGFDETVLKCIDVEGTEKWHHRMPDRGALLLAGDRLIVASSGELTVAAAKPDGYEELSRTRLFEEGSNWTPPVLVDGLLYVRNNRGELVCRDHRE